jgi:2-amino-4-hydroxy-6-hydroxymethyldihydropteridine diphosphokinase
MKQKEHTVIISLASNENQEANMAAAREQLTQLLTSVHFTSAIWTEPVNSIRKEPYLNQLCQGTTAFGEGLLCEVLKETEKRIGRTRNEDGIVAIDLDLLQYNNQRHHLRDWDRNYVKNLVGELNIEH